jgi:NAD/NADP transhydrogenase beta subunit
MFQNAGKILIFFGIIMILTGIFLFFAGKFVSFGKLPGDILIREKKFTFYFPVTTCILISLLLSIIAYFVSRR